MSKRLNLLLMLSLVSFQSRAFAKTSVRITPLGESPKGQFIAYEEYGYHAGGKIPFVKVRIMNVWKNTYVEVLDKEGAQDERLESMRRKLREDSRALMSKYAITPVKNQGAF